MYDLKIEVINPELVRYMLTTTYKNIIHENDGFYYIENKKDITEKDLEDIILKLKKYKIPKHELVFSEWNYLKTIN